MEFVKWWKNKFALLLTIVAIGTVIIAFLFAYFFSWGWIVSLVLAAIGGISMRILMRKLIENIIEQKKWI